MKTYMLKFSVHASRITRLIFALSLTKCVFIASPLIVSSNQSSDFSGASCPFTEHICRTMLTEEKPCLLATREFIYAPAYIKIGITIHCL